MTAQPHLYSQCESRKLHDEFTVNGTTYYKFSSPGQPGQFQQLHKSVIKIDHSYQRKLINEARVARITSGFSWFKFGVLVVFRRKDGSLWCVDGQHRLTAALRRSDVATVPCLVFDVDDHAKEADGFLGLNSDRGAVQTIEKFRAMLEAGNPTAKAVDHMVKRSGYEFARGKAKHTVRCVAAIYRAAYHDLLSAQVAWSTCVDLYKGDPPQDRVFAALYTIEHEMRRNGAGSLADKEVRRVLMKLTPNQLMEAGKKMAVARGSTGWRVFAEGMAALLNRGRRNIVPTMAPVGGDDND